MSGAGFLIIIFIFAMAIICGAIFLISLLIGIFGKKPKMRITALNSVIVFFVSVFVVFLIQSVLNFKYGNIPFMKVKDNTITVLCEGTGSAGNSAHYIIADESPDGEMLVRGRINDTESESNIKESSIIEKTDDVCYDRLGYMKSGYTFTATAPGTTYVCLANILGGGGCCELYIYEVNVDNNMNINVKAQYHIEDMRNIEEKIPKKFSFISEWLDYFR